MTRFCAGVSPCCGYTLPPRTLDPVHSVGISISPQSIGERSSVRNDFPYMRLSGAQTSRRTLSSMYSKQYDCACKQIASAFAQKASTESSTAACPIPGWGRRSPSRATTAVPASGRFSTCAPHHGSRPFGQAPARIFASVGQRSTDSCSSSRPIAVANFRD